MVPFARSAESVRGAALVSPVSGPAAAVNRLPSCCVGGARLDHNLNRPGVLANCDSVHQWLCIVPVTRFGIMALNNAKWF